jgi:hypothetical protein
MSAQSDEARLLDEIGQEFSEEFWSHYRTLVRKRRDETLTPEEQGELIALSDEIEAADIRRLEWLSQLACLRGVSLRALMTQLDLKGPWHV